MVKANQLPRPSLIVVTGRPGSGKTTLAHRLAPAVRCPAVCRDEVKEGLVNALGEIQGLSQDIQRQAYEVFFSVIELLLKHRVTVIAEAAFQHDRWAQKLEPMKPLAHIRIIVCTIEPQLARARHVARILAHPGRERFHGKGSAAAGRGDREASIEAYDPPHLGVPILDVDTTDGYKPAFESIVSFASARNAMGKPCRERG